MRKITLSALMLGAIAIACGSNTPEAPETNGTGGTGGTGGTEADADTGKPYPAGPYGVANGDIIENHKWQGWLNPVEANYQESALESIELADYYDPEGAKGYKAIFVNASARWCTSCKAEQTEIRAQRDEWGPKGVVFIETMFENAAGDASTFDDLEAWAKTYTIDWVFVLDPNNQLSLYFDAASTPMNMVIDPKDMSIKDIVTGSPDSSWFTSHFEQLVNQ